MQFKKRNGQMMVELLIAISIVVVSLLGMFVLVNKAIGLNRVNAEQYTATYLASEGIEVAKSIFDHGYFSASVGSADFYSTADFTGLAPGVYELQFDSASFTPTTCVFPSGGPTEGAVRRFFTGGCPNLKPVEFDSVSGVYGYGLSGSGVTQTKFRRVIIIDVPNEYTLASPLEFRITSAVGWDTRGGSFVVQLQDSFLPWRIP